MSKKLSPILGHIYSGREKMIYNQKIYIIPFKKRRREDGREKTTRKAIAETLGENELQSLSSDIFNKSYLPQ